MFIHPALISAYIADRERELTRATLRRHGRRPPTTLRFPRRDGS